MHLWPLEEETKKIGHDPLSSTDPFASMGLAIPGLGDMGMVPEVKYEQGDSPEAVMANPALREQAATIAADEVSSDQHGSAAHSEVASLFDAGPERSDEDEETYLIQDFRSLDHLDELKMLHSLNPKGYEANKSFYVRDKSTARGLLESNGYKSQVTTWRDIRLHLYQQEFMRVEAHNRKRLLDREQRTRDWKGLDQLAVACEVGDLDAVKKWHLKDPGQLELGDLSGNTPVHIATLNGRSEIVDYLISQGFNLDCANVDGDTALIDAARRGTVHIVKSLLEAGADPRIRNRDGKQALDLVVDFSDRVDEADEADQIYSALEGAMAKIDPPAVQSLPGELGQLQPATDKEIHSDGKAHMAGEQVVTQLDESAMETSAFVPGDAPEFVDALRRLLETGLAEGNVKEAIAALQHAAQQRQRLLDGSTTVHFAVEDLLADAYRADAQYPKAVALLERMHAEEQERGTPYEAKSKTLPKLGQAYIDNFQAEDAVRVLEGPITRQDAILDREHPNALSSRYILARAYRATDRLDRAIDLLEKDRKSRENILGRASIETLMSQCDLAEMYQATGYAHKGLTLLLSALSIGALEYGPKHAWTIELKRKLARAYERNGQIEEAERLHQEIADVESGGVENKEASKDDEFGSTAAEDGDTIDAESFAAES